MELGIDGFGRMGRDGAAALASRRGGPCSARGTAAYRNESGGRAVGKTG
jgi:hypothetical protein